MLGRFRSALYSAIGTPEGVEPAPNVADLRSRIDSVNYANGASGKSKVKYAYQRPVFLQLFSDDEIQVTADHMVRPIMVPRDVQILPWFTGYAEAINAGKSVRNEDQAAFHRGVLRTMDADSRVQFTGDWEIPYIYYGIFDGHAGSGCAVTAANELHQVVHKKLMACLNHLVPEHQTGAFEANGGSNGGHSMWYPAREASTESLIIGALEAAFWEMDQQIGDDKKRYKMLGGCTVLVSLFILGKLYVANAGDSRGCLCRAGGVAYPMSFDFTPVTERQRLQQLGYQKPHLLGAEYTHLDFFGRKPLREDIGKRMLYRDAHMTGWSYKDITSDDLRFPLVYGEGKRSRLLATIGVTRGFGDHDLKAQSNSGNHVYIKPFLTPQPEVRVLDIENEDVTESDVLIMATDGLWDVVSNAKVAQIVDNGIRLSNNSNSTSSTSKSPPDQNLTSSENGEKSSEKSNSDKFSSSANNKQKYRFISVAQELVMAARGKLVERNWKHNDDSPATIDDISVFVIPILPYKTEYAEWKAGKRSSVAQKAVSPANSSKSSHTVISGNENKVNMSEHDQTRSNQNNLEETGKQIGNLIADDMDMDPENEMEVDPAEEVTVSEVNLAIKDDDDDTEDEPETETDTEPEK